MIRTFPIVATAALLVLAAGTSLRAHDFWIEPRAFTVTPGGLVGLRLMVGQDMLGDALARDEAGLERFFVRRGDDQQPIPGRDGGEPAGILRVIGPGLMVVGYQSRPHALELSRAKFDSYLGEEGLDAVQTILAGMKTRPMVAREQYIRCAKALLSSRVQADPAYAPGAQAAGQRDRAMGLTLELVADRNPYTSTPGQPFPVTLLYNGVPQPDALVIAINRDDPGARISARSNAQGRVNFTLPRGGVWLIKAVHMIATPPGGAADWESFWASLTFELPAGTDGR